MPIPYVPRRSFQSHCGAIATVQPFQNPQDGNNFQSHCGAIATVFASFNFATNRLSIPLWCDCDKIITTVFEYISKFFQSHCGAIATVPSRPSSFTFPSLSIPLWCDCDELETAPSLEKVNLSIPLWCDCDSSDWTSTSVCSLLSIPLWCDCDTEQRLNQILHRLLSIPLWCDCDSVGGEGGVTSVCFQSHCGAIATRFQMSENKIFIYFQSHCGAIATNVTCQPLSSYTDFQSHCGAIATIRGRQHTPSVWCFQSHCGAIATQKTHGDVPAWLERLSIPLWCDCDSTCVGFLHPTMHLSIPLWCDCDNNTFAQRTASCASFNPTVVRLRPIVDDLRKLLNEAFQSHCGAIATGYPQTTVEQMSSILSIPLWCDCDQGNPLS